MEIRIDAEDTYKKIATPMVDPDFLLALKAVTQIDEGERWKGACSNVRVGVRVALRGEGLPMPLPFEDIRFYVKRDDGKYGMSVLLATPGILFKNMSELLSQKLGKKWAPSKEYGVGVLLDDFFDGDKVGPQAGAAINVFQDDKKMVYDVRIGGSGLIPRVVSDERSFRKDVADLEALTNAFVEEVYSGTKINLNYRVLLSLL